MQKHLPYWLLIKHIKMETFLVSFKVGSGSVIFPCYSLIIFNLVNDSPTPCTPPPPSPFTLSLPYQLYDASTGELARELRACRQGGSSIMCLRWHPKEPQLLYAADTDGYVFVYNTDSGALVETISGSCNLLLFHKSCCGCYFV